MARKPRKREVTLRGNQLLARGDIIQMMDNDRLVRCRVLSCLAREDGACMAGLEILDGERAGEKIQTILRPSDERVPGGSSEDS
ncbi:MAG: hypothetical protein AB1733_23055 [Thermodesulfobacteriota bacterium]